MLSVVVDDFWGEFMVHTREYAEFCESAIGHPIERTAGDRAATFRFAREDEPGSSSPLPLLFLVDQQFAVPSGRNYLADCGGRGTCYELKGTVCLQHLGGPGRAAGGRWDFQRSEHGGGAPSGGGCGGDG